jgi:hypothetical protein
MKRAWKPLDVGGKRLYAVTTEYFKDGNQLHPGSTPPSLVMADSPRDAARILSRINERAGHSPDIRIECHGKAINVLMPAIWWEEGIPPDIEPEPF